MAQTSAIFYGDLIKNIINKKESLEIISNIVKNVDAVYDYNFYIKKYNEAVYCSELGYTRLTDTERILCSQFTILGCYSTLEKHIKLFVKDINNIYLLELLSTICHEIGHINDKFSINQYHAEVIAWRNGLKLYKKYILENNIDINKAIKFWYYDRKRCLKTYTDHKNIKFTMLNIEPWGTSPINKI